MGHDDNFAEVFRNYRDSEGEWTGSRGELGVTLPCTVSLSDGPSRLRDQSSGSGC